jgi:hypothetical protein
MTTPDAALGIIAYLRGCDKAAARAFCEQVQDYCLQKPSFADIGEAVRQLSGDSHGVLDVAQLASELRGWSNNVIDQAEEELVSNEGTMEEIEIPIETLEQLISLVYGPLNLDFDEIWRNSYTQAGAFIRAIAEQVRLQLFASSVRDKTVGVTGDGPYESADLGTLITKLGGVVDHEEIPWGEQDYIVIGRANFATHYLEESLDNAPGIQYFSQEDFSNFLLFGVEPGYFPGDPRIAAHPGLTFLSSASADEFKWPEVDLTEDEIIGEEIDTRGWQDEHRLRSEFGYNVSKQEGLSAQQRRHRLGRAIQNPPRGLGLYRVAYHIAGLIRLNKNRRNRAGAVRKWQSDLDWLHENHYEGRSRGFRWPGWDI